MTNGIRREFLKRLSATLGTVTMAACGGGGSAAPSTTNEAPAAPSPAPSPTPAAPVAAQPAPAPDPGTIPAPASGALRFTLSGGAGESVSMPFCLGQTFRQGDIPAGSGIACGLADFQASVVNRWPDGSPKFAVLAGRAGVASGGSRTFQLTAAAAPGGPAVSEALLKQSVASAVLEFLPVGAVELQSLIGVASTYDSAAKRWTAGRVRQNIAGPVMSSWTYYSPIAGHAHLAAWFEVRCWANGDVQILPWVENGYLRVAGPTSHAGTLSFKLNGAQKYAGAVVLPHHCRTAAISGSVGFYWTQAGGGLQHAHDTAYLQQTGLVPTYLNRVARTANVLARQVTSFSPLIQADFPAGMGTAGYHPSIGLLPEWDVAYLISDADPRAQAAVLVHGLAAGRYPLHYRDETTNEPMRFSSYPDLCLAYGPSLGVSSTGSSTNGTYTPVPAGENPAAWTTSHHPSIGYLAYLVSGWSYFAEEVQFSATLNYLKQSNDTRQRSQGVFLTNAGANTTRGAAWALRTLAQAITVTPDAQEGLRNELVASMSSNVNDNYQKYIAVPNNPQGICKPYSDYSGADGKFMHAMWMEDFLTAAWGYTVSLRLPLADAVRNRLSAFFQWKAQSIVGRFGRPGVASEFNFNDAAHYTIAIAPSDNPDFVGGKGPWYADWGGAYVDTLGQPNVALPGDKLRGAYFPEVTSYWGNLQPALAYAVNHGVPGATAAYTRMISASNWAQFVAACDGSPVWGVRPAIGV